MYKSTRRLLLGSVAVIGVAVTAGTAFTASNTVPATSAGQGNGAVSGFTISNVEYLTGIDAQTGTNGTNNASVTQVEFDIVRTDTSLYANVTTSNARVFVQLMSTAQADGDWASCTITSDHATCATTGSKSILIKDVNDISVIAYDYLP